MIFTNNGQKIEIRAVYSWYDVYVNDTMILHHISQEDAGSIFNSLLIA